MKMVKFIFFVSGHDQLMATIEMHGNNRSRCSIPVTDSVLAVQEQCMWFGFYSQMYTYNNQMYCTSYLYAFIAERNVNCTFVLVIQRVGAGIYTYSFDI